MNLALFDPWRAGKTFPAFPAHSHSESAIFINENNDIPNIPNIPTQNKILGGWEILERGKVEVVVASTSDGADKPPGPKHSVITPWKDLLPVKMQNNEVILPGEREPLLAAWAAFRQEHGRELADLGWTRETLLDGLDPAKAANWDQMPFFPVLLKGGGQLLSANRIWLKFKDRHFGIIWRVQPGRWLGDIDFFDWYAAFDERAAIRQFDGRQTREQAELAAAEDLVLFDRIERLPLDGRYKADTH